MFMMIFALLTLCRSTVVKSTPSSRLTSADPHYITTMFTSVVLNDLSRDIVFEVLARSEVECGNLCVKNKGCAMFSYKPAEGSPSGVCRGQSQLQSLGDGRQDTPGTKGYAVDKRAAGCLHEGFSPKSGRCIQILPKAMTYNAATEMCQQYDSGHLLFIKTDDDLQFAASIVHDYGFPGFTVVWVGADDKASEGSFQWTDGTPLPSNSSLWRSGQPDNSNNVEDCVVLFVDSGQLHDRDCDTENHAAICQTDM